MPELQTILVVDDEINQRELLGQHLRELGFGVRLADSVAAARWILQAERVDLVLSDYQLADGTGEEILEHVQRSNPLIQFILFTAYGSINRAVAFMKQGAADYLPKPLDLEELEVKIRHTLRHKTILEENFRLREKLSDRREFAPILHQSRKMQELINLALRAAQSSATVLIFGESGTGKEMLARSIHLASPRSHGPLVTVNCAALNENLLESELFGHEKGAFTGADRRRVGRFEEAAGGTLFLDEIGDITPGLQVRLLRVLQEKKVQRLGSNQDIPADFRLIAATNRDLSALVEAGRFRSDLYYRLNVIQLQIPPLRERKEEIVLLAEHFIRKYAEENGLPVKGISREALHLLMGYDFPGNVRELENQVERAVVLARDSILHPEDFPELRGQRQAPLENQLRRLPLPEAVDLLERTRIEEALEGAAGIQTKAAEMLGLNEKSLRYRMDRLGIATRRKTDRLAGDH